MVWSCYQTCKLKYHLENEVKVVGFEAYNLSYLKLTASIYIVCFSSLRIVVSFMALKRVY